jgi:tRNA/tmRNA/rRNA uracil-C5-methylase (TrmA/RlmC/RlmD family)
VPEAEAILSCPHRPPCPGCPRYGEPGIAPEARARLARLSARAGLAEPPVFTGAPLGFRLRARLAVRGRASSPKLGIFQEGTHRIADIPRCRIHHPRVNEVAAALRTTVRETATEPYAERPHRGALRYAQIAVERASGCAQVVLVGNGTSPDPLRPLFGALEAALGDGLQGLWWNGNPERSNAILGPHWARISGAESLRETIGGIDVFHPPGAFGQSHVELFDTLARRARAVVPDGARVLELFAGTGAIGLGLLARAESVALNELSPHGLRGLALGLAARPDSERARAEVLPGDAAGLAARVADVDVLIVDPPRRGLGPALTDAICAHPPARLVYVSCGLDAFLREAETWLDRGSLALRSLESYALFPYTEHVETLAVFARA